MNEIAVKRSAEISPVDPRMARAVAVMGNRMERSGMGWVIPAENAPDEQQRAFMKRRIDEITAYAVPAPPATIIAEIGALFAVMKAAASDSDDEEIRQRIYVTDLVGVPLTGLRKACSAYRRGEIGDGKWMPTPGQLRLAALGYVEAYVAERGKLLQILNAAVAPAPSLRRSEESKSIVARTAAAFRARQQKDKPEPPPPESLEVMQERARKEMVSIKLSPAALATMGLQAP